MKKILGKEENRNVMPLQRPADQFEVELHIPLFECGVDTLHLVGDPTLRIIQALDEVVPVLRHQVGEAEEGVRLSMF